MYFLGKIFSISSDDIYHMLQYRIKETSMHHNISFITDRDCKRTPFGLEYRGNRNTHGTDEGPCQKWSDFFTDESLDGLHHSEDIATMQDKCRMLHRFEALTSGPFCMLKDYPYFANCGVPYCGNCWVIPSSL